MCNIGSLLFAVCWAYLTAQSPQQQHIVIEVCLGLAIIGSAVCYVMVAFEREQQFKSVEHPMPAEIKTLEDWTEAGKHLQEINNQNFTHEEVVLDGKGFTGCTFTHVNLFYSGIAPTALINCTFDPDTKAHFHTRNPAIAQWTEMLRSLEALKPNLNFALTPLPPKS